MIQAFFFFLQGGSICGHFWLRPRGQKWITLLYRLHLSACGNNQAQNNNVSTFSLQENEIEYTADDNGLNLLSDAIADNRIADNDNSSLVSELTGYWSNIRQISNDGREALDGFYFAENGTGLLFHSLERGFEITSYRYVDNEIAIHFVNMEGEIVDLSWTIHSLSKDELALKLTSDVNSEPIVYKRMLKIEPTSCIGTYKVTEMDGDIIDISWW
jgi:hypothetical protein